MPPPEGWPRRRQGRGLATTSLVLGILSLALLLVCGVGVLTAIAGIVVGIVAVVRGVARGRAIAGIVLSALALLLGVAFLVWLAGSGVGGCFNSDFYPTPSARQRCIERQLGVTSAP
jgi:hypothetical protein